MATKGVLIGLAVMLLIGWAMLIVCAADGPNVGWFKYSGLKNRYGWRGYSVLCNSDGNSCGFTDDYASNVCFKSALQAAIAFTVMSIIFSTFVVVSMFCSAFNVGPAAIRFGFPMAVLSGIVAIFCFLGWTIAIGRVNDCTNPTLDIDHNPAFLIVASIFYLVPPILYASGYLKSL